MIEWPDALVEDLARRRAVLFLGAGVSKNAVGVNNVRPPTWDEFLNKGLSKFDSTPQHLKSLLRSKELLTACEIIKTKLDQDEWFGLLQEMFVKPGYKSAEIHENIYKLDCRLVLTQNFDKIYDNRAQILSNNTVSTKCYYDEDVANYMRGRTRAVIKVHGTIDTPEKMVFTRYDYAQARQQYSSFHSLLDALIMTHTMIFLGCSLKDPDLQLLLERNAFKYQASFPHYIVMPKPFHMDLIESVRRNLNLKTLLYSGDNHHSELKESIKDLVASVENKRNEMLQTQDW